MVDSGVKQNKNGSVLKSENSVILFEHHFQFAAKSSVTDPKDIRIIEPDADGGPHEATHLRIGDDQTHYYDPDGAEDDDERGGWGNKLDFLFSCISVSVGLGSKSIKKKLIRI